MDLDYISTRRLSRFYDKLKDWLSLNYSTKVELAEATQDMRGATEQFAGAHGLVPTPEAADRNKFLKGDATWAELPVATTSADGLMSATDKNKLDGIATGAQVNVIESVKVAGSALAIDSKSVNVPEAGGTVGAWVKGVVSGEDKAKWDNWSDASVTIPMIKVTIAGKEYPVVKIGTRYWTVYNLDYTWNGLDLSGYTSSSTNPVGTYFERDSDRYGWNSTYKYGILYNRPAVEYIRDNLSTLAPGWRLPTQNDWNNLYSAASPNFINNLAGTDPVYWYSNPTRRDALGFRWCALKYRDGNYEDGASGYSYGKIAECPVDGSGWAHWELNYSNILTRLQFSSGSPEISVRLCKNA